MDNSSNNPGGQVPQTNTDPNATRYFPQQGANNPNWNPNASQSQQGAAPSATQQPPYSAPGQAAPPPNGTQPHQTYPTYQPTNQGGYYRPSAMRNERDRTVLALLFIGGGILFLLAQLPLFAPFDVGGFILLLIGGIFMYAYLNTRPGYRIGFLIPGSILLGLGVGDILSNLSFFQLWDGGSITTLTLGLGFCLIWVFERRHWWALIPGGILVITGLSSAWMIGRLWPLVLVAIGAYLLYDQSRRRH